MTRRFTLLALALLLLVPASASAAANPADALAATAIDPYRYDRATDCRSKVPPGTLALKAWLQGNAGGSFWGIGRCERWGKGSASLHAEHRAIDWHLDVHRSADKREASRLIRLFLATDRAGNRHALARRMGIQELIWNCRSWWSGGEGMRPYSACYDSEGNRKPIDDTTAHRDHIHIGLNWPGARKQTSFWRR
ncbi:MAG TPA: hypothetical protein VF712_13085 [Thermoleophilaceae bacterium]|jgi:hypothetical protein